MPRTSVARRRTRRAGWVVVVGVAVVLVALAGCGGVPQSGTVHLGRALPAGGVLEPGNNVAQVIATAPTPGMTQARVVTGFLGALVDSQGDYAVARLYLAPDAEWHPGAATTLFASKSTGRAGPTTVAVTFHQVGTVDPRGDYHVAPATLHTHFSMVRSDGEWRIASLPAGILLSTSDVPRTLQPASIYFFNRDQSRLVPEPLLLPRDEPGLATTLIHELVEGGPSRALAPAVVTAIPHGTGLLGTVPIDSHGVADVDLAGSVQQVSASQLERLSAQIVWTLRQLPTVTAVRLLVNGAPLSVAGVARIQPIGSWSQFDPATPPKSRGALASNAGQVIGLGTTVPASLAHGPLEAPAISADGTIVAALRRQGGRTTLLAGSATGTLEVRLTGGAISSPAFDPQGDVVVVVGVGRQSRLIEVPPFGSTRHMSVPASIRSQGISAVSISRDGSRIAMVVGASGHGSLVVGALTEVHGGLAVANGSVIVPATSDVRGVAWAGANEIVTTVRRDADERAILETPVDGYAPRLARGVGLPNDPTQVAAAPDQPILAVANGTVWTLSSRWQRVATGSDPSYAG